MEHEQKLTGRPVSAMNGEAPAAQIRLRTNFRAMTRNDTLIIIAPGLRAARGDPAGSLGLDEFHAAGIWKAFFRRIHNLDNMPVGACRGELPDCAAHVTNGRPKVGQHYDLGQR
jgi:hypothetical protein